MRWHDLRAALAPWMMNRMWESNKKNRVELEELMVINMFDEHLKTEEKTPQQAAADLHSKVNATMQMFGGVAAEEKE